MFTEQCAIYNIQILNENRTIVPYYQRSDFNKTKDVLQQSIDTGGRIFVLVLESPSRLYIGEALYDLGLRSKDIQIVYTAETGDIFTGETEEVIIKRKAIFQGAIG